MAQIFRPSTNTFSKVSIFGALFFVCGLLWVYGLALRSPYATEVGVAKEQPVPFSHKHHVAGVGLDCRYCHSSVEGSSFAGMPSTAVCMGCHSQIWSESSTLEPVRRSLDEDRPLRWIRVHDLPDFVYFDHSIHVKKGIGCTSCHGRVDRMPLLWQVESLHMEWCLECHRNPERFVRPRDQVFRMDWEPPPDQLEQGRRLVEQYGIERMTDCSVCHR